MGLWLKWGLKNEAGSRGMRPLSWKDQREESREAALSQCVHITNRSKGRDDSEGERVRQQGDLGYVHFRKNHLFTCLDGGGGHQPDTGDFITAWARSSRPLKHRELPEPQGNHLSTSPIPEDKNRIPAPALTQPHSNPLPVTPIDNEDPQPRERKRRISAKEGCKAGASGVSCSSPFLFSLVRV